MTIRAVFDTNAVVSTLLFSKGRLAWLRESWSQKKCIPIISTETTKELLRVLSYPKFQLSKEEQTELLGEYLPFAQSNTETELIDTNIDTQMPVCRDSYDQIFLSLTYLAKAEFLVTGDTDLLVLNEQVDYIIITPNKFKNYIFNN